MRRMPSLEVIGKYMDGANFIGTPLLGVSVMLAVLSIVAERRWILLLDLKVIATGLAIAIYVGYFVSKRRKQFSTIIMARWTLIGYGFVIISFYPMRIQRFIVGRESEGGWTVTRRYL